MIAKFEVGKTYTDRAMGDSNCIYSFRVVKRTEKTVTLESSHGRTTTRRVKLYENTETLKPHGSHSMCAVLLSTARRRDDQTESYRARRHAPSPAHRRIEKDLHPKGQAS